MKALIVPHRYSFNSLTISHQLDDAGLVSARGGVRGTAQSIFRIRFRLLPSRPETAAARCVVPAAAVVLPERAQAAAERSVLGGREASSSGRKAAASRRSPDFAAAAAAAATAVGPPEGTAHALYRRAEPRRCRCRHHRRHLRPLQHRLLEVPGLEGGVLGRNGHEEYRPEYHEQVCGRIGPDGDDNQRGVDEEDVCLRELTS